MSTTYRIAGKQIQCPHCGNAQFESKRVLMNTRAASFFNFDWANRQATALTCTTCSRGEWFQEEPSAGS